MKKGHNTKRLLLVLFLVGWVLSVALHILGQIDKVPLLTRIFYPSYSRAEQGLSKLQEKSDVLLQEDTGFAELERLFWAGSKHEDEETRNRVAGKTLVKLERGNAYVGFGEDMAREVVPIHFVFDDDSNIKVPLENIQTAVNHLRAGTSMFIVINVFWCLGSVISLIAFMLKNKEEEKRPKRKGTKQTREQDAEG